MTYGTFFNFIIMNVILSTSIYIFSPPLKFFTIYIYHLIGRTSYIPFFTTIFTIFTYFHKTKVQIISIQKVLVSNLE